MRILCISDLHQLHKKLTLTECDVLVIAGDVCSSGEIWELESFVSWLSSQSDKFSKVILVAGNHDRCLERTRVLAINILKNALGDKIEYLQDSECVIDGIKFYGSPWQPRFNNWAFNLDRGESLRQMWDNIPDDVNVLITHAPPFGIGDMTNNNHVGCLDLLSKLRTLNSLFLHVFGHIHSGAGNYISEAIPNVHFCNASVCTEQYEPENLSHEYILRNVGTHSFIICNEISLLNKHK